MAPGPSVAKHTPALPVSGPQVSAMNDAPRSPRAGIRWMQESSRACARWYSPRRGTEDEPDGLVLQAPNDEPGDRGLASCSHVFALISPPGKLPAPSSLNSWLSVLPCSNSVRLANVVAAISPSASQVKTPMCDVTMTLGNVSSRASTSSVSPCSERSQ